MDFVIALAAVGIISLFINKFANSAFLSVIGVVATASLGIYLIAVMFLYYTTKAEIKDFKTLESEVEKARFTGSLYGNVTLQMKINESNEWLKNSKEWNKTIFELCIPDEIEELNLISDI